MTIPPLYADVVIVGAGPVGLTTANLLGLAGIKVALIEKNEKPYDIPRAITLDDEGCRTLQATGLDQVFLPKTLPGGGARYYAEDGLPFAEVGPGPIEFGFSRRTHFFQPDLEATLLVGLDRFEQTTVCYSCELIEFEQTKSSINTTVLMSNGNTHSIESLYVIGADGARSSVRKQLGINMLGDTYPQDWIIVDTLDDPDKEPVSKFFCSKERPYVSIPAPGSGRRYEFRIQPGDDVKELLKFDCIRERLKPIRTVKKNDIVRATIYTFEARIAEKWQEKRVFLMGDAAHLTPPFAGQGLNSGLRDAHNLAWKLSHVISGKAAEYFLTTYELERKAAAWAMIELAVAMGDIVMPQNQSDINFRNMLVAWLDRFPAARDFIVSMKFKPPPQYKMGAFVDLDSQPFAGSLVGQMLPQIPVCHLDSSETRLDDIIGNNFALIAQEDPTIKEMFALKDKLWPDLSPKMIAIGHDLATRPDAVTHLIPKPDASLPKLRAHRDKIILVRPDRYVAASFTKENSAETILKFRKLLNI